MVKERQVFQLVNNNRFTKKPKRIQIYIFRLSLKNYSAFLLLFKAGFLNLSNTNISGQIILCHQQLPWPLATRCHQWLPICDKQKSLQTLPSASLVTNLFPIENYLFKVLKCPSKFTVSLCIYRIYVYFISQFQHILTFLTNHGEKIPLF